MTLFITGTNTDVGKTHTMLYLIKKLSLLGFKIGVYKPIETGVKRQEQKVIPKDALLLLQCVQKYNKDFLALNVDDILGYHFELPASPYVAKKEVIIDVNVLLKKYKFLKTKCDILLIEGAGGLNVPIEKDLFMIDLISIFKAKALLVAGSYLGCINDLLLSIEFLKNKNIDFCWAINLHKDKETFFKITYPYLKDTFDNINLIGKDDTNMIDFCIKEI